MSKQGIRDAWARIAELQKEIESLRTVQNPREQQRKVPKHGRSRRHVRKERAALVSLAPGYIATTVPGSLYSVLLQSTAQLGQLAAQDSFFNEFRANPNRQMAQKILDTIGVRHSELDKLVHANCEYRQHCSKKTMLLKNRASRGDINAKGILENPEKSKNGRWLGNLGDAISVLSGARSVAQLNRGKNVRILRKIGLMFDVDHENGEQRVFLYSKKNHRLYRHARRLVYGESGL